MKAPLRLSIVYYCVAALLLAPGYGTHFSPRGCDRIYTKEKITLIITAVIMVAAGNII